MSRTAPVLGLLMTLALGACAGEAASPSPKAAPNARADEADGEQVLARIGDETITQSQVDERAAAGLFEARQMMYDARRGALDELINDRLIEEEAARRKIDEEALVRAELHDKVAAPTDEEVEAFFNDNQAMMRGTLDEMRPQIAMHLQQQKMGERAQAFIQELRDKAGVEVLMEPPRVEVATDGSPRWGEADAPVEIVKFSDFECGFCTRAAHTVDQLKEHYGDKITVVYRHFPLPNHPNAFRAAEASQCADEQGRFWEYADEVFANQRRMGESDLLTHAGTVGLDTEAFKSCLDSGRHQASVERDIADGQAVGMTGTPGFYINGRMVSGAQPFEVFQEIIDDELKRVRGS